MCIRTDEKVSQAEEKPTSTTQTAIKWPGLTIIGTFHLKHVLHFSYRAPLRSQQLTFVPSRHPGIQRGHPRGRLDTAPGGSQMVQRCRLAIRRGLLAGNGAFFSRLKTTATPSSPFAFHTIRQECELIVLCARERAPLIGLSGIPFSLSLYLSLHLSRVLTFQDARKSKAFYGIFRSASLVRFDFFMTICPMHSTERRGGTGTLLYSETIIFARVSLMAFRDQNYLIYRSPSEFLQ